MKRGISKQDEKIILEQAPAVLSTALSNILGMTKPKNKVTKLIDGYISYNPSTDQGEETAVSDGSGEFFILLGDYRDELKGVLNVKDAFKVFRKLVKNGAKMSPWSSLQ